MGWVGMGWDGVANGDKIDNPKWDCKRNFKSFLLKIYLEKYQNVTCLLSRIYHPSLNSFLQGIGGYRTCHTLIVVVFEFTSFFS